MAIDIKRWCVPGSTARGHTKCHFLPRNPPQGHPDPTCRPRRKGCQRPQPRAAAQGCRWETMPHPATPCVSLVFPYRQAPDEHVGRGPPTPLP